MSATLSSRSAPNGAPVRKRSCSRSSAQSKTSSCVRPTPTSFRRSPTICRSGKRRFHFSFSGRSRVYHTPEDTPDKLDWKKIDATTRWLTRFVRRARTRDERLVYGDDASADASTLDELREILEPLGAHSTEALFAKRHVEHLRAACDKQGRLPKDKRFEIAALVGAIESRLA
jgi:hypothetical protein